MLAVKVTVISETAEGDITHPKYHRLFLFFLPMEDAAGNYLPNITVFKKQI